MLATQTASPTSVLRASSCTSSVRDGCVASPRQGSQHSGWVATTVAERWQCGGCGINIYICPYRNTRKSSFFPLFFPPPNFSWNSALPLRNCPVSGVLQFRLVNVCDFQTLVYPQHHLGNSLNLRILRPQSKVSHDLTLGWWPENFPAQQTAQVILMQLVPTSQVGHPGVGVPSYCSLL